MSLNPLALILAAAFSLGVSPPALAAPAKTKPAVKSAKPAASVPESNEIEFTHQLSAGDAGRLAALVERFNRQQAEGEPLIRLARAEAQRKKPAPLNLVTAGAMANFLVNKSAFKPVYQVLKENGGAVSGGEFSADLLAG